MCKFLFLHRKLEQTKGIWVVLAGFNTANTWVALSQTLAPLPLPPFSELGKNISSTPFCCHLEAFVSLQSFPFLWAEFTPFLYYILPVPPDVYNGNVCPPQMKPSGMAMIGAQISKGDYYKWHSTSDFSVHFLQGPQPRLMIAGKTLKQYMSPILYVYSAVNFIIVRGLTPN